MFYGVIRLNDLTVIFANGTEYLEQCVLMRTTGLHWIRCPVAKLAVRSLEIEIRSFQFNRLLI
jgi:hypothetical protein